MIIQISGTPVFVENGNPSEMILVIATTNEKFRYWCHAHYINHNSFHVKHIWTLDHLRAERGAWFVDLGLEWLSLSRRWDAEGFRHLLKEYEEEGHLMRVPGNDSSDPGGDNGRQGGRLCNAKRR